MAFLFFSFLQIFLESDLDQDNHLNMRELCQGLRSVTEDQITKREMDFVIRVLELADDTVRETACHGMMKYSVAAALFGFFSFFFFFFFFFFFVNRALRHPHDTSQPLL